MCRQQSTHKFDIWIFYYYFISSCTFSPISAADSSFCLAAYKEFKNLQSGHWAIDSFLWTGTNDKHASSNAKRKRKKKKRFSSSVWVELNCALFLTIFMSSIDWLLHRRLSNHYTHQLALTDLRKNGLRIKNDAVA